MKPPRLVRRRGQPLIALGMVMVSWVGARAALWDGGALTVASANAAPPAKLQSPEQLTPQQPLARPPLVWRAPQTALSPPAAPQTDHPLQSPPAPHLKQPLTQPPLRPDGVVNPPIPNVPPVAPNTEPSTDVRAAPLAPRVAAAHQELWLAGMTLLPSEPAIAMAPAAPARPFLPAAIIAQPPRWSADGWLLLRPGGNAFNAPGAGLPGTAVPAGFYGGSQSGLVLRYFLVPGSPFRPALYLRASSGLERPRGEELAAGVSLRPVPGAPLRLLAEGRVTRTVHGTIVRPAAALVSELAPLHLPLGVRAEAYVQAGYVGGRGATGFVDGQTRLEHPVVSAGGWALRAGGGVWGGVQRGASRLDLGPTATLSLRLGPAGTRVSADYRWRVAGNAAPGSGPVLTISAGF